MIEPCHEELHDMKERKKTEINTKDPMCSHGAHQNQRNSKYRSQESSLDGYEYSLVGGIVCFSCLNHTREKTYSQDHCDPRGDFVK
jgi:hypothetical protein